MANNYCAVPHAYLEECEALTDEEFGRLMRALLRYSRDGEDMEPEGNGRFFARRMMNQEDAFNRSYEAAAARRSAGARIAANARWHPGDGADGSARSGPDSYNASIEKYRRELYGTGTLSSGK